MNQNYLNYFPSNSTISKFTICILMFILYSLLTSCTNIQDKTNATNKIAKLPCEKQQQFFFPIEFDEDGRIIHDSQFNDLIQPLENGHIQDVYIFVHGWDKTVALAERDYQDFICRFKPINNVKQENKNTQPKSIQESIVIGLFWPSTVFPNSNDPLFIKPLTYFAIRDRADNLAITGIQQLLLKIQDMVNTHQGRLRLHLIGHSFGGRILTAGLFRFLTNPKDHPQLLFDKLDRLNLVLLLPATQNDALDTHNIQEEVDKEADNLSTGELIGEEKAKEYDNQYKKLLDIASRLIDEPDHPGISNGLSVMGSIFGLIAIESKNAELNKAKKILEESKLRGAKSIRELSAAYPPLRVFTIYSQQDWANRYLFPVGSIFGSDHVDCALGACGASADLGVAVDDKGNLTEDVKLNTAPMLSVNATSLISEHTDIYKDKVAELIWQLLIIGKSGN